MSKVIGLLLILVTATAFAGSAKPAVGLAADEPYYEYVPGEVLVKFQGSATASDVTALIAQLGGRIAEYSEQLDDYRITAPAAMSTEEAVLFFRQSPTVEWANFNYLAHALFTPNDPFYVYQWHYPRINLPQAWDITRGNANVVVAVCDMGFQFNHPDWASVQTTSPHDYIDNDNDPTTTVDESHGMHVAGTIFAATNNNLGVAGIAPLCTLMPIRVLDDSGSGSAQQIADGIVWAANHGAELMNLSLGFGVSGPPQDPGPPTSTAITTAANAGVVIFAATGNDAQPYVGYPALYQQCIAVGSTGYDDVRADYSNYGNGLDIMAPGGDMSEDLNSDGYADGVLSTVRAGGEWAYVFFQGTSMATPHACGVGALLMSHGLAGNQVRQALQETAVDLSSPGWDNQYGYGRINALAALQWQGGGGGETTLLNETFESWPPANWAFLRGQGGAIGPGWVSLAANQDEANGGVDPHNGTTAAFHNDDNVDGVSDDWLATPAVAVPVNATSIRFRFWQRNFYVDGYYEYHGVWYSTDGTNWNEAIELDQVEESWTQVELNADALEGQTVYFAFRYQGDYATEWFIDDVTLTAVVPGAADPQQAALPENLTLLAPYPNPFNSVAQIPFELSAPARVELNVYNLLGQHVATLTSSQDFTAGRHQLAWDASAVTSGLYFVKLTSGSAIQTRKLLLVR